MRIFRRALIALASISCAFAAPASAQSVADSSGWPVQGAKHAITGSLSSAGSSASISLRGNFNFSMWGSFTATCELDRSFDGTAWLQIGALGTGFTWSAPTTETLSEPEYGVSYRATCTSVSAGTVNYRLSQ